MNAVICTIFALCFYQVTAASYEEAVESCKKEASQNGDEPIDSFLAKGSWPAGSNNLNCFFNCVGKQLNALDKNGIPLESQVSKLAREHPEKAILQVLANPAVISKCSSVPKAETSKCAATDSYIACAVKSVTPA